MKSFKPILQLIMVLALLAISFPAGLEVKAAGQYEGQWKGTTSQNKPVSIRVENNAVTVVEVEFQVGGCGVKTNVMGKQLSTVTDGNIKVASYSPDIYGSTGFTLIGRFSSPTNGSGSLAVLTACGSGRFDWTVTNSNPSAPPPSPTPTPPSPTPPSTGERCFKETNQCISGRTRQYFEQNGDVPIFGYPISAQREELVEGKPVQGQWFQRNRLELHPENQQPYDVLLGRLGDERLKQQGRDWNTFPKLSSAPAGCLFFAETGHSLCEPFLSVFRNNGLEFDGQPGKSLAESIALFGLPISESAVETNGSGDTVPTQYFERARFEHHAKNQPPYNVLLGLLGTEVQTNAQPTSHGPTPSPVPTLTPTPQPSVSCESQVPEPKDGRVRPGKCVSEGKVVSMDVFGFQPNEEVSAWLNDPDNQVVAATRNSINIGSTGGLNNLRYDTSGDQPGLWYWVFQGLKSGHQSIIYYRIT